jgi:hypothetical protein
MNQNTIIGIVVLLFIVAGGLWYMNSNKPDTVTEDAMMEEGAAENGAMMEGVVTVDLAEVAGSDTTQTGTAVLTEIDGQVEVVLTVSPALETSQPAHIHAGDCPGVGDVVYPLENVVDGASTTVLDITMADLEGENLAINVHKSADEVSVYTACGELGL